MDLIRLIQGSLSDDLLKPEYRIDDSVDRFAGHCYVASEAYYHLRVGDLNGLKPKRIRHEGVMHWWIEECGEVIDITASQFRTPVPYEQGTGCGFLTKKPSKRAQEVIRRVNRLQTMLERFEEAGFPEPQQAVYAVVCGDSYSRGIWWIPHEPYYVELQVVPPYKGETRCAELRMPVYIMGREMWLSRKISTEEARELIDQL